MHASKRQKLQYSNEQLAKTVEAIQTGMPFKTASKTYGIRRATLQDKNHNGKKSGPETVLTEEETLLENWLIHIARCGFPGTKNQLLDSVQILVKNVQRPNNFASGRPGRRWYEGFMARHPRLAQRVSQHLSSGRSNLTENRIRQWFNEVGTYLDSINSFQITSDPSRVYNCDETAFFLSPKDDQVLVRKGDKTVYSFTLNSRLQPQEDASQKYGARRRTLQNGSSQSITCNRL
ncbi:hypothetical protein HUJ05_011887 [Dendroctonus ponderosae]|nr:hypothetical protein HUJ05_011887 [Dendroctonus ponderosae]